MKTKIIGMDYFGRGIASLDKKTFVRDALSGEEVEIKITKSHKKYDEAIVKAIHKKSAKRIKPSCLNYPSCGGCALRSLNYEDSLNYKFENVKEILKDILNEDVYIELISNKEKIRNKVSFKVKDGKLGFYEVKSNNLFEIDKCLNVKESINKIISSLKDLNIINGEIMVRSNYKDELLISINSKDKVNTSNLLKNENIVGIIYNDKTIFGQNYFYEQINGFNFKVSYKSFFQVSNYINGKIFDLLNENVDKSSNIIDLCSGVGTLSIASNGANKVLGIEINNSSFNDSIYNKELNDAKNVRFIKGDAFKLLNTYKDSYNTLIIDPPRSGIKKEGIDAILDSSLKKIIYISCNPITLKRDLNYLKDKYYIRKLYVLDMFCFSHHVESFLILEKK